MQLQAIWLRLISTSSLLMWSKSWLGSTSSKGILLSQLKLLRNRWITTRGTLLPIICWGDALWEMRSSFVHTSTLRARSSINTPILKLGAHVVFSTLKWGSWDKLWNAFELVQVRNLKLRSFGTILEYYTRTMDRLLLHTLHILNRLKKTQNLRWQFTEGHWYQLRVKCKSYFLKFLRLSIYLEEHLLLLSIQNTLLMYNNSNILLATMSFRSRRNLRRPKH